MLKLTDGEGQAIRGMMHSNGQQMFSVFDFMTKACAYGNNGASARNEFKRLTGDASEYKDEVVASCYYLVFPGRGQRDTPCMTIRGLQRLLMILGGKVASEFREIIEGTFTRVMAGDQTLIEVINANAVSQAPLQQAYRAALAQEPVSPVLDNACLGQKRERDELMQDLELAERKLRLDEGRHRLEDSKRDKALEYVGRGVELMDSLKGRANIDERTKLQIEDHVKNIILSSSGCYSPAKAITAEGEPAANELESLSVSVLATDMGFRCTDRELISIGRSMAKRFREKYQREPSKHTQYVKGNFIPVNSYMERDRALMEQAVRDIMSARVQ
jgi:hypothetical protein